MQNNTSPAHSHIKCGICSKYSKMANIKLKEMDDMSKDEGVLYKDKYRNLREIKRHEGQKQHIAIVQYLKDLEMEKMKKDPYPLTILSTAPGYPKEEIDENTVTARMLRTIYQECKLNIPFSRHPDIVNLLKLNGAHLGYHHFSQ